MMTNKQQNREWVPAASGRIAGLAVALCLVLASLIVTTAAQAQGFSVIYNFGGPGGENPEMAGLIADSAGNFYGATSGGGMYGYGAVYELSPLSGEKVLYSFTGGADGAQPRSTNLLRDKLGNLYGVTPAGGNFSPSCPAVGCGVIFQIRPGGQEKVLYSFTGGADGSVPYSTLIGDGSGNLYGVAYAGGNSSGPCAVFLPSGCGLVFELSKTGQLTPLYTFSGGLDGSSPSGNLIRDAAGNFYGTAQVGGTYGYGVVFKLDVTGTETPLYSFTGGTDGGYPNFLTRDAVGNLYGITAQGGNLSCASLGCGLVFEVNPQGNETVLYSFGGGEDGAFPFGGILLTKNGLYGTTYQGGDLSSCDSLGCGTVFKVTTLGKETTLHTFQSTDGQNPEGSLLLFNGYVYGTTLDGGSNFGGVVFRLKP